MHIEIQQSVQQVAANRSRKYYDEEIDWILNKVQDRFILNCLRPKTDQAGRFTGGFEIDQIQADKIRMLVKTNVALTPYVIDDTRYKCFLPADYQHLLDDESATVQLCGSLPTEVKETIWITRLRQDRSSKSAAPYYASLEIDMPSKNITLPADLPYYNSYAGQSEKEDISFLIPWILSKAKTWYWERFDDLYVPGSYFEVTATAPVGVYKVIVDGATGTDTIIMQRTLTKHSGTGIWRSNRLSPSEVISSLNQSSFYKSSHFSPVSELEGSNLNIYRDGSFTVSGVKVSYIRKPQPISLSLGTDCELSPTYHQQICDLAVEYIKGQTKDTEGRQLKNADLAERVTL